MARLRAFPSHLGGVHAELDHTPGLISVWYGRPGRDPDYARYPDHPHYAASMMKLAVLVAAFRRCDVGRLDLNARVRVHNTFLSAAPGGPEFGCTRDHDSDDEVWRALDRWVPLAWLVRRMITHSSNLAANLVLDAVGLSAAAEVWSLVAARASTVRRGIDDAPARRAGLTNLVTAADLAAVLSAITTGAGHAGAGPASPSRADAIASPHSCRTMLEILNRQAHRDDLATGLPAKTRIAHKNGWVRGVRHAAAVVFPDDAAPFVLAVCASTPLAVNRPGDAACRWLSRIAAAAWADRRAGPGR